MTNPSHTDIQTTVDAPAIKTQKKVKTILHVGIPKTGTTALQQALHNSRSQLLETGYYYPENIGPERSEGINHAYLAWSFTDMSKIAITKEVGCDKINTMDARKDIQEKFRAAFYHCPKNVHTMILSTEYLGCNDIFREKEIGELKQFLDEFSDDYKVVIYIRRQPELILSTFSQWHKNGFGFNGNINKFADLKIQWWGLYSVFSVFKNVFSQDKLDVRIFDKKVLREGDIVCDFADACDLPTKTLTANISRQSNESLNDKGIAFLQCFQNHVNKYHDKKLLNPYFDKALSVLETYYSGKPKLMSKELACRILDTYKTGNQRLAQEFFGRESIFDDDLSNFPNENECELSVNDAIGIAATLWKIAQDENAILKEKAALYGSADIPETSMRLLNDAWKTKADLQTENLKKDIRLSDKEKELAQKNNRLSALHTELAGKDEQLTTLHAELAGKDEQLTTLHAELAGKDEQMTTLHAELAGKDEQLTTLHAELAGKDEQLTTLHTELAGKDEQLTTLRTELANCFNRIHELAALVEYSRIRNRIKRRLEQLHLLWLGRTALNSYRYLRSGYRSIFNKPKPLHLAPPSQLTDMENAGSELAVSECSLEPQQVVPLDDSASKAA